MPCSTAALRSLLVAVMSRMSAPDGFRAAHLGELAHLDDAEELGLQVRTQLAQLVDEQRPGVGQREDAVAMVRRAGERALHVTEEVALHQTLGDGRAVEGDQGAVAARARVVDRARDELLAGAALAVDADVHVADRRLGDPREDGGHLRRLADHGVVGRAGQRGKRPGRIVHRRGRAQAHGLIHERVNQQGRYQGYRKLPTSRFDCIFCVPQGLRGDGGWSGPDQPARGRLIRKSTR